LLPHWQNWDEIKPEYKLNKETRLDFCLSKTGSEKKHFIEVKNVTMAVAGCAQFPDGVSERAQKHLRELMRLHDEGHSCEIVFVIQREDCKNFSPADEIDPQYGELLRQAHKKGVLVTPLVARMSPEEIKLTDKTLKLVY